MQPSGSHATGSEAVIAKQAGLTMTWAVLGSVLRFLSGILIVRLYSMEWLGLYAIVQSIARITSDVGNLGLDQGLIRYVSRLDTLDRRSRLIATLRRGLLFAAVGGVATAGVVAGLSGLLAGVLLRSQEAPLAWMIAGFAAAIPFMTVTQVLGGALQGFRQLGKRAIALDVLPPFVVCVGLLSFHGRAAEQAVLTASFLASQVVSFLAALWSLRGLVPFRHEDRAGPEPGLLAYSLPLSLASLLSNTARWGDVILLGLLATAEAAGLYQFAARIAAVISMVTTSVVGVFAPVVAGFQARREYGEIRRYLQMVSRWCFTFAWPSLLFLSIYAAQILLVFGDEFPPAAATLVLLTAGHTLWSLVAGNMMLLSMTGFPRLNLLNMAATVAVNVVAGFLLIPRWGAVGAALAVVASLVVWALLQTIQVRRIYDVLPFSAAHVKPILAGTVAALVSLPVEAGLSGRGVWVAPLLGGATFVAVFAGVLAGLRIESTDRRVFRELVGRRTG